MSQASGINKRKVRVFIFFLIVLFGVAGISFRNKYIRDWESLYIVSDITVFVNRESVRDLNEKMFSDERIIRMLETRSNNHLKTYLNVFYNYRDPDISDADISNYSRMQRTREKNFVIVTSRVRNSLNATTIIGIKGSSIVYITGFSLACTVPYTHGPCADKMKEIFGLCFRKCR